MEGAGLMGLKIIIRKASPSTISHINFLITLLTSFYDPESISYNIASVVYNLNRK